MIKLKKIQARKFMRYADWSRIDRIVKRFINEGNDFLMIKIGGFKVEFNETKEEKGAEQ